VSLPDFDQMTKEEIIEWFDTTEDHSALLATMVPSTAPVEDPGPDGFPLLLTVRVPLRLIEKVEAIAEAQGVSRSEIIRDALAAYVKDKTSPVSQDEAERALEVLSRVVAGHVARSQDEQPEQAQPEQKAA
jgi:predicted transcriptional regulator